MNRSTHCENLLVFPGSLVCRRSKVALVESPQACFFQCGKAIVDMLPLKFALYQVLCQTSWILDDLAQKHFLKSFQLFGRQLWLVNRMLRDIRDYSTFSASESPPYRLTKLIRMVNACEVTEPRDRIYGALGILPTSIGIQVDYTASLNQIYETSTVQIMRWSKSLDLLFLCVAQENASTVMPSWVPDYQNQREIML